MSGSFKELTALLWPQNTFSQYNHSPFEDLAFAVFSLPNPKERIWRTRLHLDYNTVHS